MSFSTIEEALDDLRAGRMIVVCDDEDRENEGDLTMAAQFATPDAVNFMAKHGRGLICLTLPPEHCDALGLAMMAPANESTFETAFTVSIEARTGTTTGISAADRARTIQAAIAPGAGPRDIVSPGHMFPLRAKAGGVLERVGQTEAAVDLARLAGLTPAGVICEVMNDDGTMARVPDLVPFCAEHGLKMVTVAQLVAYRQRLEHAVERVVETTMPTTHGTFRAIGFREIASGAEHMALVRGEVRGHVGLPVHVHTGCFAGDKLRSTGCDCAAELEAALAEIDAAGAGVLVHVAGDGLGSCFDGGEQAADTGAGANIVAELGVIVGGPVRVPVAAAPKPSHASRTMAPKRMPSDWRPMFEMDMREEIS